MLTKSQFEEVFAYYDKVRFNQGREVCGITNKQKEFKRGHSSLY